MQKIRLWIERLQSARAKRWIMILCAIALVLWVVYRFGAFYAMQRRHVFNAARNAADNGTPVAVVSVRRGGGELMVPIAVRNNRALVSGARVNMFSAGMRVGDGQIVSVSGAIDLDTGMYVVRTRDVADGLHMAAVRSSGYFVPLDAVRDGSVLVVRDGVAVRTPVRVARTDADTALISEGLVDGDMVVTSHVADGARVQINAQEK